MGTNVSAFNPLTRNIVVLGYRAFESKSGLKADTLVPIKLFFDAIILHLLSVNMRFTR